MKINNKKRQSAIAKQRVKAFRAWMVNKVYEVLEDALENAIIYGTEPKYKPERIKNE